jgi:transcriptional pleiotropic regulator of transition state genes
VKTIGIARKIDSAGKISVPRQYRELLKIKDSDILDVYIDGDRIVLTKHEPSCTFCGERPDGLHSLPRGYGRHEKHPSLNQ